LAMEARASAVASGERSVKMGGSMGLPPTTG
jgi:hypothetical protein